MKTSRRTLETPWEAVDVLTNEVLGWYDSEVNGLMAYRGKPEVRIYYRPSRRKAK